MSADVKKMDGEMEIIVNSVADVSTLVMALPSMWQFVKSAANRYTYTQLKFNTKNRTRAIYRLCIVCVCKIPSLKD